MMDSKTDAMTARAQADAAWAALERELDAWQAAGRSARIWWRDDDAADTSAALERLTALSAAAGAPVALAVVPSWLTADLPRFLKAFSLVTVLQHGWAHVNHAKAAGEKGACEVGLHRGRPIILDELSRGKTVLEAHFAERFVAAIVPPWNRIDPALPADLARLGFAGLSAYGARATPPVSQHFVVNNCHADPIDWKRGGNFRGAARTLAHLVNHLAARRTGAADPGEATGLLTHHLDMDESTWAFTERLVARLSAHPAVHWADARETFAP